MKRTICLKLKLIRQQEEALLETQATFSSACNAVGTFACTGRCWNQVSLHHMCYYRVRQDEPKIGAQMVCNAIRKVCASYKVLKIKPSEQVPTITFRDTSSIHYCSRTFSLKGQQLSLYTTRGRIRCSYQIGDLQQEYLNQGSVKEAELVRKGKRWFFHLVLDIPDQTSRSTGCVVAVDMGENNIATTSYGTIHGGKQLRHQRDRFLNRRKKLQSNGSRSAKRCLRKISGKEKRRVREVNHVISKRIVEEAQEAKTLVMEDLTNIRKRIKGNKRMRSRLHRWPWKQLQLYIEYKAQAKGIEIVYVNPAYTSLTCSQCGHLGTRIKHTFKCSHCGSYQHSDSNACQNLCKLAESAVSATAPVNVPMVAA